MANRAKILINKRTSLKSKITNLNNILDKGTTDDTLIKLRLERVTELFHAYEDFNDELTELDPNESHQTEYENIEERYYLLAAKIKNRLSASNISEASTSASHEDRPYENSLATSTKKRRIKLPEASLPTFDGKFESWLSFKNSFRNMIGSQTDLSDIDKLHYLKSALTGEAANKIKIFETDDINYSKAWELLERSYEVKRILISRHLSSILNLPVLEKETSSGLSKLADDVQQHIASLSVLGASVGPEMIVHVLETKLPKSTAERWENSLERETFPEPDQIYDFLYKSAVFASKRERTKTLEAERSKGEPPIKKKRYSSSPNKAFVLNTSRNCIICRNRRHPLHLCEKFKQLPVQKRIDAIKTAKLCYNCLRSHKGNVCNFSNCSICNKRHNSLLHIDNYANTHKSDKSKSTSVQTD
ncbi:uncharacterized protein LOC113004496 [Solenopsis invicta]|uniref:uncharacterized protein LOC113004496 n=1 Tax=Solenopsis invicta TaxID=13686 RepID=UPI00193DDED3|nr:uncharacterized protein LOC113004496 [Solenopsis invicta]